MLLKLGYDEPVSSLAFNFNLRHYISAPTGHTLRLLSLPDFLDASIGKIVRLRQKLTGMGDAVKVRRCRLKDP
jgi:hypothetical protein